MKILTVGAQFFHPNRRTDIQTGMKNLKVASRNFANAPKIGKNRWKISERHSVDISSTECHPAVKKYGELSISVTEPILTKLTLVRQVL